MVHPATRRVVKAAISALGVPLDIGFVFPPKPGEARGFGQWTNRDLTADDITVMLPRAAAANARGGNVYMRLSPSAHDHHPGLALLDDLSSDAVTRLQQDGFEPTLVVETSPANFQAWIRLVAAGTTVPYSLMGTATRWLAQTYDGDMRAVSPRQPGRVPGFTNRKAKHQNGNGSFPFVRLLLAEPELVASAGPWLIDHLSSITGTAAAAAAAAAETPRIAADQVAEPVPEIMALLDAIYLRQLTRIQREITQGRRPVDAGSLSEVDFATVRAAQVAGIDSNQISGWLARVRPEKDDNYVRRTLEAAETWTLRGGCNR